MTTPRDAIGLTKAQGYADSLRQQARWIEEALDDATPQHQRVDIGDIDIDELNEAATQLDALSARVKELEDDVRRLHSDKMDQFERAVAAESLVKELEGEQEPLVREVQRVNSQLADEMQRATRAGQERDKLQGMLLLCGELGGIGEGETPVTYLRRLIDGLIDAHRERDEAYERAAEWHDVQADALESAINMVERSGGYINQSNRGKIKLHRLSAAAIRSLASGPDKEK